MADRLSPARSLGATGVDVPLIGYGTAPLGKMDLDEGARLLNHAIDRGITYLDTSPSYGSEPHLGEVMQERRSEVFLATKIDCRSVDGVTRELNKSLQRLHTDHVDLIQVHAVNAWADLEQALAPGGALEALETARDQGKVRFIGITGHARPEILGHALTQYPFDTVLVALGACDRLVSHPELFCLPKAVERNVGVIAMKVFAHGQVEQREAALRYSLGREGVSLAILGLDDAAQIDEAVELASRYEPLSDDEEQNLLRAVQPLVERDAKESHEGKGSLFWLHDTAVLGWRKDDEPAAVMY